MDNVSGCDQRLGIVGPDIGPFFHQSADQIYRGRFAYLISIGLEGKTKDGHINV